MKRYFCITIDPVKITGLAGIDVLTEEDGTVKRRTLPSLAATIDICVNYCNTWQVTCRDDCRLPYCGDGETNGAEQCDAGAANSDTTPDACRTTCVQPRCGDGVVDAGEACDAGPGGDPTGACRADCQLPCSVNAECAAGEYCLKAPGDCNGYGECVSRPPSCLPQWAPVCACNGQTYDNSCYPAVDGVTLDHDGVCAN